MQVRLDGKAIRGAKDADGNQVRLFAALAGPDAASSVIAAQAEVGKKKPHDGRTLHGPPMHHPRTHIMILERPWAWPGAVSAI